MESQTIPSLESLRAMVGTLVRDFAALKMPLSREVVDAFAAVPRHLLLPDVPLERAYAYDAVAHMICPTTTGTTESVNSATSVH